jgi:hypothetical protein
MVALRRALSLGAFLLGAAPIGCSLTHRLDGYGDEFGAVDAADAGANVVPEDATDAAKAPCVGVPMILEPAEGASVGASVHLRVSAPPCLNALIAYIDSNEVANATTNAIDQWVTVGSGSHTLNVNGWAGTATAHPSTFVKFTRP